jgi:hypothetical protein
MFSMPGKWGAVLVKMSKSVNSEIWGRLAAASRRAKENSNATTLIATSFKEMAQETRATSAFTSRH